MSNRPPNNTPNRSQRSASFLTALLGLFALAAIIAVLATTSQSLKGHSPLQGNSTAIAAPAANTAGVISVATMRPTYPASKAAPASQPSESSSLLFSAPIDSANLHNAYRLGGFGVMADGSLWIGDGDGRLLHYTPAGTLMLTVGSDITVQPLQGLALQGENVWTYVGLEGFSRLRKLDQSGRLLTEYHVPESIKKETTWEPTEKGISGITLGGNGELLIRKQFESPYAQIVAANGTLSPTLLPGYPANGKLYIAAPDGPPVEHRPTGHVTAGTMNVTVAVTGTLYGLSILRVDPDGGFYVQADETVEGDQPGNPKGSYSYLLHYSPSGQLLQHARAPYASQLLAAAPDDAFYALDPQLNDAGVFSRVDVLKLNFFDAAQPLPPLPTPTITPILPTNTPEPPTYTPAPLPTPVQDLALLAQQSDLIVRAKTLFTDGQSHTAYYSLQPEEWIKNPGNLITDKLALWVLSGRDWGRPIPVVLEATVAGVDDDSKNKEYIVFLHKATGWQGSNQDQSYWLTDEYTTDKGTKFSNAGVFSIENGKIGFAGIPKYAGWTVNRFIQEIHRYAPTPLPVSTAERDLSIQAQNAEIIAEVEWQKSPPRQAPGAVSTGVLTPASQGAPATVGVATSKNLLQIVAVRSWLKNDLGKAYIGLYLTPDQYSRLSTGTGHYVVFLHNPDFTDECSDTMPWLGYFALQGGLGGIFELNGDQIAYSGVPGYEGYTLANFKSAVTRLDPTPVPSPTIAPTGEPISPLPPPVSGVAGNMQQAAIIAKVEFSSQATGPGVGGMGQVTTGTFTVQEWLKKPAGYTTNTIHARLDSWDFCRFSLGKGPYVIMLDLDKNASPDDPEHDLYHFDTGGVYGIQGDTVVYGSYGGYLGEPVARLEADIRAALLQPTSPQLPLSTYTPK